MALIYSYQDSSTRYMSSLLNQCFYNPIHLLCCWYIRQFAWVWRRFSLSLSSLPLSLSVIITIIVVVVIIIIDIVIIIINIIVIIHCHYHHYKKNIGWLYYIISWKEIQSYKKSNKYWAVFVVIIVKINQSIHTYLQSPFNAKHSIAFARNLFFWSPLPPLSLQIDPLKDYLIILDRQLLFRKM